MAVWAWVLVAVGGALVFSTLVGLTIARILGRIAADVTELLEGEEWSGAPLTRELDAEDDADGADTAEAPNHKRSIQ
jgi:hypothetical protein